MSVTRAHQRGEAEAPEAGSGIAAHSLLSPPDVPWEKATLRASAAERGNWDALTLRPLPAGEGITPRRGLSSMRVVVTRPHPSAGGLARALSSTGAIPLIFPTVALQPAPRTAVAEALASRWNWIILTSANGAASLEGHVIPSARVAAVGPATATALRAQGWPVDWIPERASGAGIAAGLPVAPGDRILLLRSDAADPALARDLAVRGAQVEEVVAYRTEPRRERWPELRDLLARRMADAVTLASPSAVEGLVNACDDPAICREVPLVSIGPTTSAALRRHGLSPASEAATQSVDGLISALGGVWKDRDVHAD